MDSCHCDLEQTTTNTDIVIFHSYVLQTSKTKKCVKAVKITISFVMFDTRK